MGFNSISKNALLLAAIAVVTTAAVAITQVTTKTLIIKAQHQALKDALFELLPEQQHNNDLLNDYTRVKHPLLALETHQDAFFARFDGQPVAAIIPVTATEGYGGAISMLVGIRYDGTITGVRVVGRHNETPGLGDKIDIDKSDWILGFNGKSLNKPGENGWKVKKDGGDFDQMTGATITPRAVVKAVYNTLLYFDHNKEPLFRDSLAAQMKKSDTHKTNEHP